MVKRRAYLTIRGKVQNVCFRANAQNAARKLGLAGFVRNLPDRSVECTVEGDQDPMNSFLDWIRNDPKGAAIVDSVDVDWADYTGEFPNFPSTMLIIFLFLSWMFPNENNSTGPSMQCLSRSG